MLNYTFFSSGKLYRYISKYSYDEKNYKYEKFKLTIDISGNCKINNRKYCFGFLALNLLLEPAAKIIK